MSKTIKIPVWLYCTICGTGQLTFRFAETKDSIRHEHYQCNNCGGKEVYDFDLMEHECQQLKPII